MENVQAITGKGVEGLEHCPPVYHFDLSGEEFQRLLKNPKEVLASMGKEALASVDLDLESPVSVRLGAWSQAYSETEGWHEADPEPQTMWTPVCCYASADQVVCHKH
jgi:hypothetical protein